MHAVTVGLPGREYPILIGPQARAELARLIDHLPGVGRIVVVADRRVAELHADRLLAGLGRQAAVVCFSPGEASKSLAGLSRIYDEFARCRLGRADLVMTFGGGVAGDLGGFAAATWMRGLRFIQVPTTLAAAVDASIGGKTGINHPAGKNLIGAFHQPAAVVIDTDFLETLPRRDYLAGLAESVKHAAITGAEFLEWHEASAERIVARDPDVVAGLIARNCRIKADVVARDERETGLRMRLNHGHTLGHAFEHLLDYELRHGECVALGMLAENELARVRGLLGAPDAGRIARLVAQLGLPTRLPRRLEPAAVMRVCALDKKVRAGQVNFVLLGGLGQPQVVRNVTADEVETALRAVQPR